MRQNLRFGHLNLIFWDMDLYCTIVVDQLQIYLEFIAPKRLNVLDDVVRGNYCIWVYISPTHINTRPLLGLRLIDSFMCVTILGNRGLWKWLWFQIVQNIDR